HSHHRHPEMPEIPFTAPHTNRARHQYAVIDLFAEQPNARESRRLPGVPSLSLQHDTGRDDSQLYQNITRDSRLGQPRSRGISSADDDPAIDGRSHAIVIAFESDHHTRIGKHPRLYLGRHTLSTGA